MTDVQPEHDTARRFAGLVRLNTPSTRRGLLAGAGAVGATAVLAACGTQQPTDGVGYGTGTGGEPIPAGSANPGTGSQGGGDSGGGDSGGGSALAAVSDVPVGGGIILAGMVITQPTEGEFKAFDKKCTHQGCPVTEINNGTINCKCHNSAFSIEDGSPTSGPARQPLAERRVRVDGDSIVAA